MALPGRAKPVSDNSPLIKLAETTNLLLNPGINQLIGDYLGREDFGIFTLDLRERAGLLGVFHAMLAQPPTIAISTRGTVTCGLEAGRKDGPDSGQPVLCLIFPT